MEFSITPETVELNSKETTANVSAAEPKSGQICAIFW